MNSYQLACLDTSTLQALLEDIKHELSYRKRSGYVAARRKFISSMRPPEISSNDEAAAYNASRPLAPPSLAQRKDGSQFTHHARYLPALISQDWGGLFGRDVGSSDNYVYAHVDPRLFCFTASEEHGGNFGGLPFYIGKGSGLRAHDLKRNQAHGKRIQAILDAGFEPSDIVKIVFDGLSGAKAFELESKLILFFRTEYETPKGPLVNLDIPARPELGAMIRYKSKTHWMESWAKDNRASILTVSAEG